jgi:2',3'-cyclic-nucleotide 2'-phosphodiesterase (5'-nucleotidase family)
LAERYSLEEVKSNELQPDEEVNALIKKYEGPFSKDINKVVGYSTVPLYRYFVIENTIDTMILNGLKWRVPEVDVVLSNGFRFCPPRVTRDETGQIPITEGYIFDMLPVDSQIRRGEVTGLQIMQWLEKELNNVFAVNASERFGGWVIKFQGMKVKFKAFAEKGQRVQEVLIGGVLLDPQKEYSICACERDGDPDDMLCRIKNVKNARNTEYTLHQMMRAYLQNNSPVSPELQKNAVALDAPETLLTQVWGVDYEFR